MLKLVEDTKTKLLQAQESQAKYCDIYHCPVEFPVNDEVLLSTKNLQLSGAWKFQQYFVGLLIVTERIGGQAQRLQIPAALQKFYNVFHISLLKPNITGGYGVEQPQPIIIDSEPKQEVETILRHRHHWGMRQYLVKYAGYDQSEAMWVDESEQVNTPNVLADYQACMRLLDLVWGSCKELRLLVRDDQEFEEAKSRIC